MVYRLLLSLCLLLTLIGGFLCFSQGEARGDGWQVSWMKRKTIKVAGLEREYWLYVPSKVKIPAKKRPVVMMLHGGSGRANRLSFVQGRSWKKEADADGVILVYPQGIKRRWNDGRKDPMTSTQGDTVDDVAFLARLIDHVVKTYDGDPHQVSVGGVSNGAMMTNRLACEIPQKIASIAVVIGSMPQGLRETCRQETPLSVLILNGTADPLVPYNGGAVTVRKKARGSVISTKDMAHFWAENIGFKRGKDRFLTENLPDKVPNDGTHAIKKAFLSPKNKHEVVWYTIQGGGHTWPGGSQYLPKFFVGKVSQEIDGNQVIWTFFKAHRK